MRFLVACVVLGVMIVPLLADTTAGMTSQNTSSKKASPASTQKKSTPPQKSTPTPTPEEVCNRHNGSCEDCVKETGCLYCKTDDGCKVYPSHDVLPKSSLCALSDARWGVCWLNFEALIISVSVIGGVIILTITFICVYCCCCRNKSKARYEKEDTRYEQQKMERKIKQDERRSERKSRLDEIRRKYGLVKDDAPYQRFDA